MDFFLRFFLLAVLPPQLTGYYADIFESIKDNDMRSFSQTATRVASTKGKAFSSVLFNLKKMTTTSPINMSECLRALSPKTLEELFPLPT